MLFNEETDNDFIWTDYTDRHVRRLAHKRSIHDLNTIYDKIIENRVHNIANDDNSQIDCNSYTDTEDIVTLQYNNNIIDVQMLVEDCKSINEVLFCENNSTSGDSEIQSENDYDTTNTKVRSNTSYEYVQSDLKFDIMQWAKDYKIHLNALTNLLQILNKRSNITLPKDGRTLMGTPKETNMISMGEGFYCHFGVKSAIYAMIEDRIRSKLNNFTINLIVSTDGAPIGISSGKVIWPILCSDELLPKVRIIGIYYGQQKPVDSNTFLETFVNEIIPLINIGVMYNEIHYTIRLHAVVCDAPAKSFILKVKNHTGYDSCSKCVIHGYCIDDTICFPTEKNYLLRDDEIFRNFGYSESYQKAETILINIPHFGPVSNVPLDYMHLVCLGVMRKLVFLWIRGPLKIRLSSSQVQQISEKLLILKKYTPSDFPRKARSLHFIKLWKATEFRQFLLYSGPIILNSILNKNVYEHFLALHIAIRILASTEFSKNCELLQYAEKLLNTFVTSFALIYGAKYVSHNVHNLLHLTSDVRKFGAVDVFSAFQFENYICGLNKLVRKGEKPLQQIDKRLREFNFDIHRSEVRNKSFLEKNHKNGPLHQERNYKEQYKILHLDLFYLNCDDNKNNCVILKDNTIICVYNIAKSEDNNLYVIGKKLIPYANLFNTPCESQHLGIVIAMQNRCIESWLCHNICAKAYKIPYHDKFVIIPILHTIVSY